MARSQRAHPGNHSCRPNTEIRYPHNSFELELIALRDIAPDEVCTTQVTLAHLISVLQEITISYMEDCLLHHCKNFRRQYLQENYLFTCACDKCAEQAGHSEESDPDSHDGDSHDDWEDEDDE